MHAILVFESKVKNGTFMVETLHMTGEDVDGRLKAVLASMLSSWHEEWRLVSMSHTLDK